MKIIEKSLLMGIILSMVFSMMSFSGYCQNIENKVLRLHILANSDSAEDQDLKLKVRDRILEYSGDIFSNAKTRIDAENITESKLNEINKIALDEIHNNGYNYDVKVELTNMYFNTRHYNEVTLPAGNYDALRILIGNGEGRNWWCVMFPAMCLPAAEDKKELCEILTDPEMDIVEGDQKYEIEFKCIEAFGYIRDYLETIQENINQKYDIEI